jgi:ribosomal subunit interface protein
VASHLQDKISAFEAFNFVMPNVKAEIVFYNKEKSFTTRLNIQVVHKGTIRSEAHADDVLTSINKAVDKILDQLRRVKTTYEK